MTRPNLVRLVVFVSTVALSWAALTYGVSSTSSGLRVGQLADRTYLAEESGEVLDTAAFEGAQERAAQSVEPVLMRSSEVEERVVSEITNLFGAITAGVETTRDQPLNTIDTTPAVEPPETTTTSTTLAEGETTTTTVPPDPEPPAVLEGLVFADPDGDGIFAPDLNLTITDTPLAGVRMIARGPDGQVESTMTGNDGLYAFEVPAGTWEVGPDFQSLPNPEELTFSSDPKTQVECPAAEICTIASFGLAPLARPIPDQVAAVESEFSILDDATLETLVTIANHDIVRRTLGRPPQLPLVEDETVDEAFQTFRTEIADPVELRQVQNDINQRPPSVTVDGLVDQAAQTAVADVLVNFLQINMVIDQDETESLREEARAAVDQQEFFVPFIEGQPIISERQPVTQFALDAIEEVGSANARQVRTSAVAVAIAVLVTMLGYYLSRFRAHFWDAPRMVALLGLLMVLAAGAVRLTVEFQEQASPFILPAVAFGYLASVLFDNRMATLMALAVGMLAAIGTRDPAIITFGVLATLAPIGFVSRVSSRRAFRNSVVKTAGAVGVVAAATAWLFTVTPDTADQLQQVGLAVAWAIGASVVAALVALSVMPFFESAFDITTTLRLLELTDRNHEALQTLQAKAFGSFNHSLMVGTLADAAARAIGANNLLARAAAYYHDLGKTENPSFFIENQFGGANPHDEIPPEESARIIRDHVIDGIELARRYKIPSEVSEGILAHHGDAIMRFFYEKARQQYGDENVDVDDYRHAGHKPRSREMAIVMMADSVEGACRAVFGDEEPTPQGIEKVVNRIVDEKVADGQLSQSDLTLGELTAVKSAFIDALVGHYHQRIPYPNFPGS